MRGHSIRERQPRESLVGAVFGRLTVAEWTGSSRWRCSCSCGGEVVVLTANLKRSNTRSCGCIKRIVSSKRATTHGLSNTAAYKTWCSIKRRCYDPKVVGYHYYGGRGIDMAAEWRDDAAAFIRDVGQPPSDAYSLDRIDVNRGYHPGNVRWATALEQGANKRNNRRIVFQGQEFTLAQLVRHIASQCSIPQKDFSKKLSKELVRQLGERPPWDLRHV